MLTCSKCGLGVIVINLQTITACNCNAPVIASMSSSLKGLGGLVVAPPAPRTDDAAKH